MKRKLDSRSRADILKEEGYSWLAGKWFKKGLEAPDVRRELLVNPIYLAKEAEDADKAMAYFIGAYGNPRGKWPESPAVSRGLALLKSCGMDSSKLPPMALPLTHQQLIVLNRLLYGGEEIMFIATGTGGSGKSTFGNVVAQCFGNDVAFLNLQELSDDFHLAMGVGKRLIYSDELNAEAMKSNVVKVLVSKQDTMINPKYGKPYSVRWQGTLFFCCNKPPRMDVSDPGLMRRICYFYMNKRIANPDPSIQKREYSREEIDRFVAHALAEPTANWFEENFMKDTHKAIESTNPVWLLRNRHRGDYGQYKLGCNSAGYTPVSEGRFAEIWQVFQEWERTDEEGALPF